MLRKKIPFTLDAQSYIKSKDVYFRLIYTVCWFRLILTDLLRTLVRWTLPSLDWYGYISFLHIFLICANSNWFHHSRFLIPMPLLKNTKLYFTTSVNVSLPSAIKKINRADKSRTFLFSERLICASCRNVMTSFQKTKAPERCLTTAMNATKCFTYLYKVPGSIQCFCPHTWL